MSFKELPLHPHILKALEKAGYDTPTEIQAKAIAKVAKGHDVRASAQTGTGKTAAFLLPILSRLATPSTKSGRGPRAVILVPTRELAMQVASQSEKYSCYMREIKTACVVGGVPYQVQLRKISKPYDILIATPGRLIDFMNQGKVNFSRTEVVVLDEADRMLDMGFSEPVQHILEAMPESRQTLLFSATLEGSVMRLSEAFMNKPMEIVTKTEHKSHDNIDQKLFFTDNLGHKTRVLEHVLANEEEMGHVIIFTATKRHADQLTQELQEVGHRTAALHGDMTQGRRTRTIRELREGKFDVLVATDVAARGIDVKTITHVINFDLPQNVEDYVHRIGRTGRAGRTGTALSFVSRGESFFLQKIEKFTGKEITVDQIEGLEPAKRGERSNDSPSRRMHPRGGQNRFRPRSDIRGQSSKKGHRGQRTESFGDRGGFKKKRPANDSFKKSFDGPFSDKPKGSFRKKGASDGFKKSFGGPSDGPRSGGFKKSFDGPFSDRPKGSFRKKGASDGFKKSFGGPSDGPRGGGFKKKGSAGGFKKSFGGPSDGPRGGGFKKKGTAGGFKKGPGPRGFSGAGRKKKVASK